MSSRYYPETGLGFLVDKDLIITMIENFKKGNVSHQELLDSLHQQIEIEELNNPDLDYEDILTEMYYYGDVRRLDTYDDYASYFKYDIKNDCVDFSSQFGDTDFYYIPLSYHISLFKPSFKSEEELEEEIFRFLPALPKSFNWKENIIYFNGVVFG